MNEYKQKLKECDYMTSLDKYTTEIFEDAQRSLWEENIILI